MTATQQSLFDTLADIFKPVTSGYHNTTHLTGESLADRKKKASTQEEQIYNFFREHRHREFTPTQIWSYFEYKYPITSIRRAITNLTNAGYLVKTETRKPGIYGDMNYCWRLK